jgi:hypothetical protein
MKRVIWIGVLLIVIGMGWWWASYPVDWQNWLGFSKSAYFTTGQNYAFLSGFGPCLITALGLSTIVAGLWHAHNCHYDGCMRIGRHKVNGTPWCNHHHGEARQAQSATLEDVVDRLDQLIAALAGRK